MSQLKTFHTAVSQFFCFVICFRSLFFIVLNLLKEWKKTTGCLLGCRSATFSTSNFISLLSVFSLFLFERTLRVYAQLKLIFPCFSTHSHTKLSFAPLSLLFHCCKYVVCFSEITQLPNRTCVYQRRRKFSALTSWNFVKYWLKCLDLNNKIEFRPECARIFCVRVVDDDESQSILFELHSHFLLRHKSSKIHCLFIWNLHFWMDNKKNTNLKLKWMQKSGCGLWLLCQYLYWTRAD